jgi:4-amino-4-deoxy-L-arabinose transferase-like glycosyltransferase
MSKKTLIIIFLLQTAAAVGFELSREKVALFSAKLWHCSWLFPSAIFFVLLSVPIALSIISLRKVCATDRQLLPSVALILFAEAVAVFSLVSVLRARACVEIILKGERERFSTMGSWDFVSAWSPFFAWFAAGFTGLQALLPVRYVNALARRISPVANAILTRESLWLLFLSVTAFGIRLLWVLYSGTLPVSDCKAFNNLALGMAHGEGYVKHGGIPTAYWLVGYPLFLAALYTVFGTHLLVAKIANSLAGAALAVFTYILGKKAFSKDKARLGALIVAILPGQVLYSSLLASEMLFCVCCAGAIFTVLVWLNKRRWYIGFCAAGALIGCASLVRGPGLLLLPLLYLYILITIGINRRAAARLSLLTVLVFVIMLPWAVRNARVFGSPVFLTTNSGVNFWVGNNERAQGTYMDIPPDSPVARASARGEVAANDAGYRVDEDFSDRIGFSEVAVSDAGWRAGLQFILKNPKRFLSLVPYKLYYLYAKDTTTAVDWNYVAASRDRTEEERCVVAYLTQGAYLLLCLFAAIGMIMVNKKNLLQIFFIAVVVGLTGFHILFFGLDRFHVPLEPIFALFAASAFLMILYRGGLADRPQT